MPGVDVGRFVHPLRSAEWWDPATLGGLPVIDMFRDIIDLEQKSVLPPADLPSELEPDEFLDPEAAFIRVRDNPAGTGGPEGQPQSPVDLTWAFNQATGARPEADELPEYRDVDDRNDSLNGQRIGRDIFTGELVFPINPRLPSLNRQPGIILVPVGLFHIFGTITLFGGQQLVGVAPTPTGSVLVKVGDGACIRTQHAMDLGIDRHRSPLDAAARLHDNENGVNRRRPMQEILQRLSEKYRLWWAQYARQPGDPQSFEPPDEEAERRRLEIFKQVVSGEAFGSANVRISGLRICQRDTAERVAREPVQDILSDFARAEASTRELRDLRELPIEYSSFALDLRGPSFAIVEDLHIVGFERGVGIHIRPRTPTSGSQTSYYNQIRRCVIDDCHRGILAQFTLGICFGDQCGLEGAVNTDPAGGDGGGPPAPQQGAGGQGGARDYRVADRLSSGRNTANSTVIMDCRIRNFGRAGIEAWGPTFWIFFCAVQARTPLEPEEVTLDTEPSCIVLPLRRCVVYRCRLINDYRHVLLPPGQFMGREPVDDVFGLHVRRRPNDAAENIALLQSVFEDSNGDAVAPRVQVLELEWLPNQQADDVYQLRRTYRDAWDPSGGFRHTRSIPLDITGPNARPQTSWTSDNLLANSRFLDVSECRPFFDTPRAWRAGLWRNAPRAAGQEVPSFVTHGVDPVDPLFRGNVMRVVFPKRSTPSSAWSFRLFQDLIAPEGRGTAGWRGIWSRLNVLRGKRLVAACWVRADHLDAVRIGFRQRPASGGSLSDGNWRVGDWLLLSTAFDMPGNDSDPMEGRNPDGLWFEIIVQPPAEAVDRAVEVLVGAPQINLGPDLFPVGPMRPGTLTFDGRLLAPLQLRRGIVDEVPIRLEPGQARAAALFGTDAVLESIHADAGDGAGRFVLEHISGGEVRPLATWSSDGCGCAGPALAGDVALRRGDRVRVRRLEGAAAMTVHLQTVHSKVV